MFQNYIYFLGYKTNFFLLAVYLISRSGSFFLRSTPGRARPLLIHRRHGASAGGEKRDGSVWCFLFIYCFKCLLLRKYDDFLVFLIDVCNYNIMVFCYMVSLISVAFSELLMLTFGGVFASISDPRDRVEHLEVAGFSSFVIGLVFSFCFVFVSFFFRKTT